MTTTEELWRTKIQTLEGMGFSTTAAEEALKKSKGSIENALEDLLVVRPPPPKRTKLANNNNNNSSLGSAFKPINIQDAPSPSRKVDTTILKKGGEENSIMNYFFATGSKK